jgi:hypothetical protein
MPVPSTVKVRQAIDDAAAQLPALQQSASGMQAVALAALAPFLPSLLGTVHEQLPTDPAQLDELLSAGAGYMLSLRSDPQPEPPAAVAELAAGDVEQAAA